MRLSDAQKLLLRSCSPGWMGGRSRIFDIKTYSDTQKVVWVKANSGCVSAWKKRDMQWSKTWLLPAGSVFSNDLRVWHDAPGHWLWEPAVDMPILRYQAALAQAGSSFVRVT